MMQVPRFRFTIGRMMALVLLAGLASWCVFVMARLKTPTIAEQQADAAYKQAFLAREVAEYAPKEYVEGVFKQDVAGVEEQIALAESDLERATDRVKRSNSKAIRDQISDAAKIADQLALNKSRFELEQARTKREVLLKYTKDKTVKELTSEIQKARADEQAKLQAVQDERAKRWRRILGL